MTSTHNLLFDETNHTLHFMGEISTDDKLLRLAELIDWTLIENSFQHLYQGKNHSIRIMIGLLYLQAKEGLTCSEVIEIFKEKPVWQEFCGIQPEEVYLLNIHPSTLSILRREIGAKGAKIMVAALSKPIRSLTDASRIKEIKSPNQNVVSLSASNDIGDKELIEVIDMKEKDMDKYLEEKGLDPEELVSKAKQYWREISSK